MPQYAQAGASPEPPQPPYFGEWLKRQRKALDLTQDQLAQRVHCARVTIRKIEADEMRPSRQMAELLARALAISDAEREAFVQFARGQLSLAEWKRSEQVTPVALSTPPHDAGLNRPPSGTVTFLFTDIEGSTRIAQQLLAAWPRLQARHHVLLRQAIEAHQGTVFQVIGDAFCAAFHTAPDALAAALDAQRALHSEPWGDTPLKVRMGLHTGAAEFRDGAYRGYLTLAHAPRVMATASGGQTLASSTTAALLSGQLPDGITLRDMGEHRLKGLLNVERLWQVTALDLPGDFPPPQSQIAIPNNLPIQLTSFVGREKELAELQRLLPTSHLLTLTGSGGTGKTRLSLQAAASMLDAFEHGVWFIELAPVSDPALVAQTVASVMGVHEQSGYTILRLLLDYLRDRRLLIVLDNCEHLVEACAQFADTVLRFAPAVKILASSREALGIAGEQTYPVPSLQLPDPKGMLTVEGLAQVESIRLFTERVAAIQPGYVLTDAQAPAVAQICRRLDGIPLAIELAAARVKTLNIEQINQKLDDRFRLLTGGSRTALPRQQTLRALIDWSYNLLVAPEQLLFCRLSVFVGGWTLDAAETICCDERLPRADILDGLAHLVDKSLLLLDEQNDSADARYRMLETVRQYARERLLDSGEGDPLRGRHLAYYLHWAEEAEPKLKGADQLAWLKRWEAENDNIRAALDWPSSHAVDEGLRLASAATWFWWLKTRWSEGCDWLERLLAREGRTASAVRTIALCRAAHLAIFIRQLPRAKERAEEALRLAHATGDLWCVAESSFYMGLVLFNMDEMEALSKYEESLELYQKANDRWGTAVALMHVGGYLASRGTQIIRARAALAESLGMFRQLDDRWGQAITLGILATLARLDRDYVKAQACDEEALKIATEFGNELEAVRALQGLGRTASLLCRYSESVQFFEASLKIQSDAGMIVEYGWTALPLGLARLHLGEAAAASELIKGALKRFDAWKQWRDIAACIDGQAAVYLALRQPERAVRLSAAAEVLLEANESAPRPEVETERKRTVADARGQLSESDFTAAWEAGRMMSPNDAIALALQPDAS